MEPAALTAKVPHGKSITAIILPLRLEPTFPGTVAVVAPAIFVINVLHFTGNRLIDRRHGRADRASGLATKQDRQPPPVPAPPIVNEHTADRPDSSGDLPSSSPSSR
jgi:hypothetical protein